MTDLADRVGDGSVAGQAMKRAEFYPPVKSVRWQPKKITMLNRKHIFEWWMFHLSWTKTVAENPCQPTVLVSLAYGGLTLFTQTNFWWFRRIPDSLVTSHIQAWWLWWPQDFLESAAKMKCHGYVHHVFLKNSIVSFSELPNKYELYLNESCLIYNQKKNYKPELEVGTLSIFRKFWCLFEP